jgi:hypothetical protein
LDRNTTLRLQFTTLQPTLQPTLHLVNTPKPQSTTSTRLHFALQPTLPSATIPRLRSQIASKYYITKAPELLVRLLRPTVPKLRSIPLPRVTTPPRHLNVTSQPSLLQFTTGRLLNTGAEISDLIICVVLSVNS